MGWEPLNLSAVRGSTEAIATINFWHHALLTEPVKAGTITAPIAEIFATQIPIEIPVGTKLRFVDPEQDDDCAYVQFVTASVTAANSNRIEVVPSVGAAVPCEYIAPVAPVDLSGREYSAMVRAKYENPAPLFSLGCTVNALAGAVELRLPQITATPNVTFADISHNLADLQEVTAESKSSRHRKLVRSAYYWDLEYTYQGESHTEYMGFFWLIWEATR